MCEQDIVHRIETSFAFLTHGREHAGYISRQGRMRWFVHGVPLVDAVAESLRHDVGEIREPIDGFTSHPAAAAILQPLRSVPVIEACCRPDTAFEKTVNEPVVVVKSGGIGGLLVIDDDAGPRDGESVDGCADFP